jgi:hypothetical protein
MAYINQPIDLRLAFDAIKDRLRKLETAVRFTAPDVSVEPTYPRVGDIIYNNTEDYMEYWNGTEWSIFGDNNVGVPKVPFTSTWTGTGLAYTGTPATGYYQKIGKSIFFTIRVNCTTVTNFGTGGYNVTLPFTPDNHYIFQNGGIHHAALTRHYTFTGDCNESSSTLELLTLRQHGTDLYLDPLKQGTPVTLNTADYFYISGTYFIA